MSFRPTSVIQLDFSIHLPGWAGDRSCRLLYNTRLVNVFQRPENPVLLSDEQSLSLPQMNAYASAEGAKGTRAKSFSPHSLAQGSKTMPARPRSPPPKVRKLLNIAEVVST